MALSDLRLKLLSEDDDDDDDEESIKVIKETSGLANLRSRFNGTSKEDDHMASLKAHAMNTRERGLGKGPGGLVHSGSINDDRINNRATTLIPFTWDGNLVEQEEAIARAAASGETFPTFKSHEEATVASIALSKSFDNLEPVNPIDINPIPITDDEIEFNLVSDGLGLKLVGGGELVATMASDLVGVFFGGLIGGSKELLAAIDPDDEASLTDFVEVTDMVRDLFRYNPRTIEGKAVTQFVGDVFHAMLVESGRKAGHFVLEHTGSVPLAAATATVPEAIFILLPFIKLKGKGSNLASETGNALKEKYIKGEKVNVFSDATIVQLEAANARIKEIRSKSRSELLPKEISEFNNLKATTEVLNKKLAETHGKEFTVLKKTDDVIKRIKAVDKAQVDPVKVAAIIKTAVDGKGKPAIREPVEMIVDGTNTIITKGIESAIAAKVLGEKSIPVNVIVPKPKVKNTKAQADKVFATAEASKKLETDLKKAGQLTLFERLSTSYDITKPFKDRIKKSLPKNSAIPIIALFEQMENAGSSAAAFARGRFEPVFSQIDRTKVILERTVQGVKQKVTESDVLNQIVQSRVAGQISKRRQGKFIFSNRLTAEQHASAMLQLKNDLGPDTFNRINTVADQVFDVYRDLLDIRFKEGLIDKALHAKLRDFDYSPIEYQKLIEPEGQVGLSVDSGVKKLKRGNTDITNFKADELLGHSIYSTFNLVARNRVLKELNKAVIANPLSPLAKHVKLLKTSKHKTPQGTMKVVYKENGKDVAFAVDPFLAKVWIQPKDITAIRGNQDAFRMLMGVTPVKSLAVGLDFTFPITEIPRSIIGVGLSNSVSMKGLPMFGGSNVLTQAAAGFPIAVSQMLGEMGKVVSESFKAGSIFKTKDFQTLAENNGIPKFVAQIGLEEFNALKSGIKNDTAREVISKIGNGLSAAGIWSEALIRTAIFKQGKIKGLSDIEAAAESLRFVNYNNVGKITGPLDNISPFFSAAFNASKSQARGFREAPLRTGLYGASVASIAIGMYYANWLTNPEGTKAITDEHLGTGFNIVMPKQFTYRNADGHIIHRYIHIPADGFAVPFLASAGWAMRKYNENRDPDEMIYRSLSTSTLPTFGVEGVPMLNALTSILGNYSAFKKTNVYPRNVGSTYQEYYAGHEQKATPQIYVDAGKWLHENGIVGDAVLEGFKSPERLRAAFNAFVPNHPFISAMNTLESHLDPNLFEYYNDNRHLLNDIPGISRVLKETSPDLNLISDIRNATKPEAIAREDAVKKTDQLISLVINGGLNRDTAFEHVKSLTTNESHKVQLMKRVFFDTEIHKIYGRLSDSSREGIPNMKWWGVLGSIKEDKDRAGFYIERLKGTSVNKRDMMESIKRQLSATTSRFRIITSEYAREEARLKKSTDMTFEPGIFHYSIAPKKFDTEDIVE